MKHNCQDNPPIKIETLTLDFLLLYIDLSRGPHRPERYKNLINFLNKSSPLNKVVTPSNTTVRTIWNV